MRNCEKNKPYVSLKLPHGLMDCRIKSGNDNREYDKRRNTRSVMPGFMPGIRVLMRTRQARRRWPGQARP
jgi:hypothetical protein